MDAPTALHGVDGLLLWLLMLLLLLLRLALGAHWHDALRLQHLASQFFTALPNCLVPGPVNKAH